MNNKEKLIHFIKHQINLDVSDLVDNQYSKRNYLIIYTKSMPIVNRIADLANYYKGWFRIESCGGLGWALHYGEKLKGYKPKIPNDFYKKITKTDRIKFCAQSVKIADENEKTKKVLTGCSYWSTMPFKNASELNAFFRQEHIPSRLCEDYTKIFCYDDEYFFAYNIKHDNFMQQCAEKYPLSV